MALASSVITVLLLPLVILSIFAISATARPCKTIFFITSSSNFQNPNSNSPHRLTFFITEIHRTTSSFPIHHQNDVVKPQQPSSSIRDRTIDIMTIVDALLFGVGCGALTAATMYFIWYLLSNIPLREDDDYVSDDDGVTNKKKMTSDGYVSVPVKQIPPTADEIDAMI